MTPLFLLSIPNFSHLAMKNFSLQEPLVMTTSELKECQEVVVALHCEVSLYL